jgi:hypothetical protein
MVLSYSKRLRRRAVTRPGSMGPDAVRPATVSIQSITAVLSALERAVAGGGGMVPAVRRSRTFFQISICRGARLAVRNCSRLRLAIFSWAL